MVSTVEPQDSSAIDGREFQMSLWRGADTVTCDADCRFLRLADMDVRKRATTFCRFHTRQACVANVALPPENERTSTVVYNT